MPAAYDAEQLNRRLDKISERFGAIEAHLAILSEEAGVHYCPPAEEVPPEVAELARSGDQLGAIKRSRELTGADLAEARNAVLGV